VCVRERATTLHLNCRQRDSLRNNGVSRRARTEIVCVDVCVCVIEREREGVCLHVRERVCVRA